VPFGLQRRGQHDDHGLGRSSANHSVIDRLPVDIDGHGHHVGDHFRNGDHFRHDHRHRVDDWHDDERLEHEQRRHGDGRLLHRERLQARGRLLCVRRLAEERPAADVPDPMPDQRMRVPGLQPDPRLRSRTLHRRLRL
jgi:hypothetical protein